MPFDNLITRENLTMPSVNQWGRENPDSVDHPDGAEFVPVTEAQEHGYFGVTADDTPRERYTVAGVTSGEHSLLTGPGVETHGATEDADEGAQSQRRRSGRHETGES